MTLEKSEMQPTTRYEAARMVSAIVHPVAFPLLALGLSLYVATHSLPDTVRYVMVACALTTVPISVLVAYMVLRRKWTDLDVSVRRQRYALYPFGLACMFALALAFERIGAPEVAVRSALALFLANIVNGLVNFFYKVSAHATGAAASATLLWIAVPVAGVCLLGTVGATAVGWSRVELKRHTSGQVLLGWSVGVLSMVVAQRIALPGWL